MIHQTKTLFFYKEGVHTKVAMILKVFDLLNIRVIFLYFNCVIRSSCLIGKHVKRRSVGNITEQYQHGTARNVIVTSELSPEENFVLFATRSMFTFLLQLSPSQYLSYDFLFSHIDLKQNKKRQNNSSQTKSKRTQCML